MCRYLRRCWSWHVLQVSDECGKTLGLVYSSKDSIVEAVRCGRGVYYSRSRGGLWRKGDTSGAWQALKGIKLDCDSDALLFTVKQMGSIPAFCHLNTRNCWGEDTGLTALEVSARPRPPLLPARCCGTTTIIMMMMVMAGSSLHRGCCMAHL